MCKRFSPRESGRFCRCDIAQKGKCLPCCDEMLEDGFLLHGKNNNYFLALKLANTQLCCV